MLDAIAVTESTLDDEAAPDPLRVYADLYHQAVECRRRVDVIRSLVSRAAEALEKRPERFRFDGIEEVWMPRSLAEPFATAEAWPSAVQIQQVLGDWHAASVRLAAAWNAVWPRDRELLARSSPETADVPKTGYCETNAAGRGVARLSRFRDRSASE